jgi:hypothetical protein
MIFRCYLSLNYAQAMSGFLNLRGIPFGRLKPFLLETSGILKGHAQRMAREQGRPYRYLETPLRLTPGVQAVVD